MEKRKETKAKVMMTLAMVLMMVMPPESATLTELAVWFAATKATAALLWWRGYRTLQVRGKEVEP